MDRATERKALVIGGLVIDYVVQMLHRAGKKSYLSLAKVGHGGAARNVGLAARALGLDVSVLGAVGEDPWGNALIEELSEAGICTRFVQKKRTLTGFSLVCPDGILSLRGANDEVTLPEDLDLSVFDYIYVGSIQSDFQKSLRRALKHLLPLHLYVNPGAHQLRESREELLGLVQMAEVLQVDAKEAELLSDRREDPAGVIWQLSQLGPKTVVLTCGHQGAWAVSEGVIFHQPALPARPVDPTGCGDAFAAGLLASLARGFLLRIGLAVGSANAASVLEQQGVAGFLSMEEALQRAGVLEEVIYS